MMLVGPLPAQILESGTGGWVMRPRRPSRNGALLLKDLVQAGHLGTTTSTGGTGALLLKDLLQAGHLELILVATWTAGPWAACGGWGLCTAGGSS